MRTLAPKAEDIRGRAARRWAGLLLALALTWTALGSNFPRVVSTAADNGSPNAASKPTVSVAQPFQSSESDGKIAFKSASINADEIWVMNADGTAESRLASDRVTENIQPAFAASGSKIVFSSNRDDINNFEIYVITPVQ